MYPSSAPVNRRHSGDWHDEHHMREHLRLAGRRYKLIIGVTVASTALAAVSASLHRRVYESTASVVIESEAPRGV